MESGKYTRVGNWWDRCGENELDLVAINEFNHTGMIAEVKRNERKISLTALENKVAALPQKDFAKYQFQLQALSLQEIKSESLDGLTAMAKSFERRKN